MIPESKRKRLTHKTLSYQTLDFKPTKQKFKIKQGGEVGSFPCDKALFDRYKAGELKDYTEADFDASFNDRYNRLQVATKSTNTDI